MTIAWQDELAIGHHEIDAQHREIFERFHRLTAACEEGRGTAELAELVGFLEEYAREHFATEERLMVEYGFPGLAAQEEAHRSFMAETARFRQRLGAEGASDELLLALKGSLIRWLIQHIRNLDGEFGSYLKDISKATP